LIVGLGLIAGFLFLFFDLPAVASVVKTVNLGWYGLAFFAVALGVTFYALAWRSFLRSAAIGLGFRKTLSLTWTSIFFNLIVPTASVSGEVARAYLASREAGVGPGDIAATIFGHRIVTLVPFLAGSVVGVILLGATYMYPSWLMATVGAVVAALATAFLAACYLSLRPERLTKVVKSVTGLGSRLLRRPVAFSGIADELASLRGALLRLWAHPRDLVPPMIYSLLFWLSDVSVAYLVFLALGEAVPLDLVAVVYTIGITMQMIPLGIPAYVGPVELIMTTLYSLEGVKPSVSAAATILIKLAMMWFELAVGGIITYLFEPQVLGLRTRVGKSRLPSSS